MESTVPATTALEIATPEATEPETTRPTAGERQKGLVDSLGSTVLSSIPVLSALLFLAVAIKVFRASNMETTTTVAVISSADVVSLFEGVLLTLLPGFLAGVVAISIWWWSKDLTADPALRGLNTTADPSSNARLDARHTLQNPKTGVVWVLLVVAFYTITWPLFLVFLIPVATATILLIGMSRGKWLQASGARTLLHMLRLLSALLAIGSILLIALSPTVWLPLRAIHLTPGTSLIFDGKKLPTRFAAFVLSTNAHTSSLLLNSPRGVLVIDTNQMDPNPPLCIPRISSLRWANLRASQMVHLDHDYGSPYQVCP